MKPDNASSGTPSGPTSATPPPAADVPAASLTEAQYLAQQSEIAKQALARTWEQMKAKLGQGAAPQVWAREYPWITVGAAAVAGFVAASALIPSKEEQALRKLAAIERALNPHPPKTEHSETNGNGKQESPGMVSTILREVLAVARPAIVSLLTSGIGGAMQPQPPQAGPDSTDKSPPDAPL